METTEVFRYSGSEELEQVRLMAGYNRHIAELILAAIKPGQAILDFGAGTGTISVLIRDRAQPARMLCLEIDRTNIAALKHHGFDVVTDVSEVQTGTTDVIYSSNVLEHIEDDVAALQKLHACLKPGGRAVFWVPAFESLWTAMDDRVEHRRRYTRRSLSEAFSRANFQVEQCFYQDSLGFFVTLGFKFIGNREGRLNGPLLLIYDRFVFPVSRLCDAICSRFFGKNVVIYARKPGL